MEGRLSAKGRQFRRRASGHGTNLRHACMPTNMHANFETSNSTLPAAQTTDRRPTNQRTSTYDKRIEPQARVLVRANKHARARTRTRTQKNNAQTGTHTPHTQHTHNTKTHTHTHAKQKSNRQTDRQTQTDDGCARTCACTRRGTEVHAHTHTEERERTSTRPFTCNDHMQYAFSAACSDTFTGTTAH